MSTAVLEAPLMPEPFLEVHVRDYNLAPALLGLCVGYENKRWRLSEFARHVMEWLPEFALDAAERDGIRHNDCLRMISKAANSIYKSPKYQKRGEFGELLLHMVLRQEFDSVPAVSKIYFKSATNETVKGFDAVHVVGQPGALELWLGEVKFYTSISGAIAEVTDELQAHSKHDYLREEFLWIGNKLDLPEPHRTEIAKLTDRNTSLDQVFSRICFPVLVTYDSKCIATHTECSSAFIAAFDSEVRSHHAAFVAKGITNLRVHLIVVPIEDKAALTQELDRRLRLWQQM